MSNQINEEALGTRKTALPEFGTGDQIRVWIRIIERDRTRLTPFEGIVIRRRGRGLSETFIVRRTTHGEGVERVFPIHAPVVDRIEVLQRARPPRARLYFLRTKVGKTRLAAADSPKPSDKSASPDKQAAAPATPAAPAAEQQPAASS
jgi:large subunit ribosomal protein L19